MSTSMMNGQVEDRKQKKKRDEGIRRTTIKNVTERLRETLKSVAGFLKVHKADVYLEAFKTLKNLCSKRKGTPDGLHSLSTDELKQKFVKDVVSHHGGKEERLRSEKRRREREQLCIKYLRKLIVMIKPELSVRSDLQAATKPTTTLPLLLRAQFL
ncbi:hypothetical protein QR680_010949 [Steinernema hermaphroditum]|uniref:Uncharacterized protein n=1 Tax=Steinernema hermaphroditum TaxID=289476 RepID=A0AA39MCI9_9BILA|nr:hypothetical protein QR680_010949 [Steinernema hermaphroditum]